MPRLSSDEGTATLSSWLVAEGEVVERGAILAELETDKATVELEAVVAGRIESLLVAAGTEGLKPGALLCRIVPAADVAETTAGAARSSGASPDAKTPEEGTSAEAAPDEAAIAPSVSHGRNATRSAAEGADLDPSGRSPATPLARRLALAEGLDLGRVKGTGVGGRIEKADIERSLRGGGALENETADRDAGARLPRSEARAVEPGERPAEADTAKAERAERTEQKSATRERQVAHATDDATAGRTDSATSGDGPRPAVHLKLRCRMEAAIAARARLNEGVAGVGPRVTLNDFVVRAAALAWRALPEGRSGGVDVALVVATEQGAGIALLRDADRKGLAVLSEEIRRSADSLRAQDQPPAEIAAALLVTSFARFGIESAHPMLPPGVTAVLAVGALVEEPVVREGELAIGARMALTLAFDPTRVGGATMARMLAELRGHLEDPLGMML